MNKKYENIYNFIYVTTNNIDQKKIYWISFYK
jgi:hypothetical protein